MSAVDDYPRHDRFLSLAAAGGSGAAADALVELRLLRAANARLEAEFDRLRAIEAAVRSVVSAHRPEQELAYLHLPTMRQLLDGQP